MSYEDEASADTTTAAAEVLPSSKSSGKRGRYHFRGAIGEPGGVDWIDVDWIKVTLDAEQMYRIVLKSGATGSYDLLVMGVEDDCQPDNTSTHDSIDVGGSRNGRINYGGDTDWFRAELTGGTAYTATVTQGEGASPIPVPRVLIYDTAASMVAVGESASDMNSSVASYTPEQDGTYYIVVRSRINRSGKLRSLAVRIGRSLWTYQFRAPKPCPGELLRHQLASTAASCTTWRRGPA